MKRVIATAATLILAGGGITLATASNAQASHNPPHCASLASIYQGALNQITGPARPSIVVAYNAALAAHHCTQQVS